MSDVVYLYGFVPAGAQAPPADVGGIANAPVRVVVLGEVGAAVADLPAAEFGADLIEARLQDLAWVGAHGMGHERVVVWFADHSEIVPARMFSLYSSERALRAAVDATLPAVARSLRALTGRREWNLKVAYDADRLAAHGPEISQELQSADEEIANAAPGRRYLLQRRRADMLKQEVSRAARRLADDLLDSLRGHAVDVLVLPLSGGDDNGTVVLNAALLVARDQEPALRAHVDELYRSYTELGMIVTFSGPWAPYRFVEAHGNA